MIDENCIFCKIGAHEVPTAMVYEDEYCIAFDDLTPIMPVHTLIIPKDHYANIGDNIPQELLGHLFSVVGKIADMKGVAEGGYRVLCNTGDNASQSVKHFHIHVIGGGWMPRPNDQYWGPDAINALSEQPQQD